MSSLRSLWPHLTLLPLSRRILWVDQESRDFGTQLRKFKLRYSVVKKIGFFGDWESKEPTTVKEFREAWGSGSKENQLVLLNKLDDEGLHRLFSTDVSIDIFQNILALFLELYGEEELIMKTLMTLARASRFSLCLLFMESKDRANVRVLIDRLEKNGLEKIDELKQIY